MAPKYLVDYCYLIFYSFNIHNYRKYLIRGIIILLIEIRINGIIMVVIYVKMQVAMFSLQCIYIYKELKLMKV